MWGTTIHVCQLLTCLVAQIAPKRLQGAKRPVVAYVGGICWWWHTFGGIRLVAYVTFGGIGGGIRCPLILKDNVCHHVCHHNVCHQRMPPTYATKRMPPTYATKCLLPLTHPFSQNTYRMCQNQPATINCNSLLSKRKHRASASSAQDNSCGRLAIKH